MYIMFSYIEIWNTRLKTKTIYINVLNEWYSITVHIQHHYITVNEFFCVVLNTRL